MADQQAPPAGPDLSNGIALSEFAGRTLLGHVGDDEVVLVRSGSEIFAIGAHCSHYHGPLAEGFVTGEGIRCPWHHACFDLRTGEATRAPALSPIEQSVPTATHTPQGCASVMLVAARHPTKKRRKKA